MEQLTLGKFVEKFDKRVRGAVRELAQKKGVSHLVLFENQDFTSSQFGARTALAVGPSRTYQTLESVEGQWLNDLPSQRQYPVAYAGTGRSKVHETFANGRYLDLVVAIDDSQLMYLGIKGPRRGHLGACWLKVEDFQILLHAAGLLGEQEAEVMAKGFSYGTLAAHTDQVIGEDGFARRMVTSYTVVTEKGYLRMRYVGEANVVKLSIEGPRHGLKAAFFMDTDAFRMFLVRTGILREVANGSDPTDD